MAAMAHHHSAWADLPAAVAMPRRRVLIIGGSFSGLAAGRDLGSHYLVTIIDAKERCWGLGYQGRSKAKEGWEWSSEYFEYTPGVLRAYVKPKHLDALTFTLQPVIETRMACKYIWGEVKELNGEQKTATYKPETIDFDYCIIAAGCNFGPFHKFNFLKSLNDKAASVLVVGAGFIGVEWATEIQHFFPRTKLTIIDFLPQPLGPLPANAATYCEARL
eukprot:Skav217795  [mRNA]  locus=scaffold1782:366722:371593:- [translate_table: standard]